MDSQSSLPFYPSKYIVGWSLQILKSAIPKFVSGRSGLISAAAAAITLLDDQLFIPVRTCSTSTSVTGKCTVSAAAGFEQFYLASPDERFHLRRVDTLYQSATACSRLRL